MWTSALEHFQKIRDGPLNRITFVLSDLRERGNDCLGGRADFRQGISRSTTLVGTEFPVFHNSNEVGDSSLGRRADLFKSYQNTVTDFFRRLFILDVIEA